MRQCDMQDDLEGTSSSLSRDVDDVESRSRSAGSFPPTPMLRTCLARRPLSLGPRSRSFWSASPVSKLATRLDRPPLVELFDSASPSTSSSAVLAPTGLFGQPSLARPAGLRAVAEQTTQHARLLLDRLHQAPSAGLGELRLVVRNFDRLSDTLCGVIDMCELIWTCHPDRKWVQEAAQVYDGLCRVMNEMNVDQKLFAVRPLYE